MSEELEVIAKEIAAELTDDGDTWELDDGREIRLKIEHDDGFTQFEDGDCYGSIAPVERSRWEERERPRPSGFDGRARKIGTRDGSWWWQPPKDIEDDHERIEQLLRLVRAIMEEGFYQIGVELISGQDAYHQPIVVAAEWLGGVEPMVGNDVQGRAYYREVIEGQIVELLRSQDVKVADVLGKEDVPMG